MMYAYTNKTEIINMKESTKKGDFFVWNQSGMPVLPEIEKIIVLFEKFGLPMSLAWNGSSKQVKVDTFVGGKRGYPENPLLRGVRFGNHYVPANVLSTPPSAKGDWLEYWTLTANQIIRVERLYKNT
jgi:hypothetical protein